MDGLMDWWGPLERAEVGKAASQTDEVETKLFSVQQQLSTCQMEMASLVAEKEKFKVTSYYFDT